MDVGMDETFAVGDLTMATAEAARWLGAGFICALLAARYMAHGMSAARKARVLRTASKAELTRHERLLLVEPDAVKQQQQLEQLQLDERQQNEQHGALGACMADGPEATSALYALLGVRFVAASAVMYRWVGISAGWPWSVLSCVGLSQAWMKAWWYAACAATAMLCM